jgi:hypothetical protein
MVMTNLSKWRGNHAQVGLFQGRFSLRNSCRLRAGRSLFTCKSRLQLGNTSRFDPILISFGDFVGG